MNNKRSTSFSKRHDNYGDENIEPVVDNNPSADNYDRSTGRYSMQVGAFYSKKNAIDHRRRIRGLVESPVVIIKEDDLYKVRVEGISTKDKSMQYKRLLQNEDIPSYLIEKR